MPKERIYYYVREFLDFPRRDFCAVVIGEGVQGNALDGAYPQDPVLDLKRQYRHSKLINDVPPQWSREGLMGSNWKFRLRPYNEGELQHLIEILKKELPLIKRGR